MCEYGDTKSKMVWIICAGTGVLYVCIICVGIVCVNMAAPSSPHSIQTLRVCVLCGHIIYVCM